MQKKVLELRFRAHIECNGNIDVAHAVIHKREVKDSVPALWRRMSVVLCRWR